MKINGIGLKFPQGPDQESAKTKAARSLAFDPGLFWYWVDSFEVKIYLASWNNAPKYPGNKLFLSETLKGQLEIQIRSNEW